MDAMEIQEQLDEVRVRLLETLASLPEEALLEPNAIGNWSVADVLAHFVNWEAELVTALNQIDQGKKPARLLTALADRDAYNAERYADIAGRDLDRIFDDLQGVRAQLEEWLEEFSRKDLETPGRYPGLGQRPLWKLIAVASFEHEAAHIFGMEKFAEKWLEQNPAAADVSVDEGKENGHRP